MLTELGERPHDLALVVTPQSGLAQGLDLTSDAARRSLVGWADASRPAQGRPRHRDHLPRPRLQAGSKPEEVMFGDSLEGDLVHRDFTVARAATTLEFVDVHRGSSWCSARLIAGRASRRPAGRAGGRFAWRLGFDARFSAPPSAPAPYSSRRGARARPGRGQVGLTLLLVDRSGRLPPRPAPRARRAPPAQGRLRPVALVLEQAIKADGAPAACPVRTSVCASLRCSTTSASPPPSSGGVSFHHHDSCASSRASGWRANVFDQEDQEQVTATRGGFAPRFPRVPANGP